MFFREILERVIQNTATPLRIDFVSVANIHNRIPCLAEGPIAAARPHRGILELGDSHRILVAPKKDNWHPADTCKPRLSKAMSIRHVRTWTACRPSYIFTGESWDETHCHFPSGIFTHTSV
jgi:hypothetical protein